MMSKLSFNTVPYYYILLLLTYVLLATAQQYAGDNIPNSMPKVLGAEIAYFRIPDPTGKNNRLTLLNYYTLNSAGRRHTPSKLQRVVINVPGRRRNPAAYIGLLQIALSRVENVHINRDSVAIMSILTPNQMDKHRLHPRYSNGSVSNALIWSGDSWGEGVNNVHPTGSTNTSLLFVLDSIIRYFSNAALYPALKEIVVCGHSMGGQILMRYAALAPVLQTRIPIVYWIGNPNSYVWFSSQRPLSVKQCPTYDNWKEGFSHYPSTMTYGRALVAQGRAAVLRNMRRKRIVWAHALLDHGDRSDGCGPYTQGVDRNERFSAFLTAFPPYCNKPETCHMVDYVKVKHDDFGMLTSSSARARLFTDNFHGLGHREYDFGYPRQQRGDNPYPNPALKNTPLIVNRGAFGGNMKYQGCFANQKPGVFAKLMYSNSSNSVTLCTKSCFRASYPIAAMQNSTQCYCGMSMNKHVAVPVIYSSCYKPCPGDSTQTCGGPGRLAVYSTRSPFTIKSVQSA